MRGFDPRFAKSIALICLPAAVSVFAGVYFLVREVPAIVRQERRRVVEEYRAKAFELKENPSIGTETERGKGGVWTSAGKMAPGRWGYGETGGGKALVWYAEGRSRKALSLEVDVVREKDYALLFNIAVPSILATVVLLSSIGIRYFTVYVKSRDDFLAASAHDLATPLVGMRFAIGRDDETAKALNERMMRLVANICDFLKLGGKRPPPKREEFNFADAYSEAYRIFAEDYRDVFGGEDVPVLFDGCAKGDLAVEADETLAVQVVWNLLGNDLKYAAPFGRVAAVFSKEGSRVVLRLRDEGKGMSRREMSKAFDRYYRAKTVLESGKGGFGIGLCTSREFAAAMGGSLAVSANEPRGCVFEFSLPAAGSGA
jgi:signal transduction histidine kinase